MSPAPAAASACARRARGAGRLHRQHRPPEFACVHRRDLQPVITTAEGSGAGDDAHVGADGVRRAKRLSAEQPEGAYRLDERPTRTARLSARSASAARPSVWATDSRKRSASHSSSCLIAARAAIDAGPDRRPDRSRLRRGVERRGASQGGKIKAYAVLSKTRWASAPEVPTIDEAVCRVSTMTFWHGLWVPKGTPHGCDRQAQCCGDGRAGRSDRAGAARTDRVRTSCHASSRRRRRSARTTKPRSRNGGRSSRPQASRPSERCGVIRVSNADFSQFGCTVIVSRRRQRNLWRNP